MNLHPSEISAAPLMRRGWALLSDVLTAGLLTWLVGVGIQWMFTDLRPFHLQMILGMIFLLLYSVYFMVALRKWGKTLGMHVSGLRIAGAEAPLSWSLICLRLAGLILTAVLWCFWVAWVHPRKYLLQDVLSKTVIVFNR